MASELRRRFLGAVGDSSSTDSSRAPSPAPILRTPAAESAPSWSPFTVSDKPKENDDKKDKESDAKDKTEDTSDDADPLVAVPLRKLVRLNSYATETKPVKYRISKRRTFWVFGLGGLVGILLALFFASKGDVIDFSTLPDMMNLESVFDVLPAWLIKDARDLQKLERDTVSYDSFAVGLHAKSQGVTAVHPVIMVPGVISTGLESWSTDDSARQYFRKRLWGSWSMMRALVSDKAGWKRHIMVDKTTGLDPPGVKLRAAQGFDATDFFITGYWIWNKILENLATVGYDPNNAFTAAYDWRLSYSNLEVRDQFFDHLKNQIETAKRQKGKKVALLSHSMGSQVVYYFFHWVEAKGYGNGGASWVEDHIETWINISGCMLGATKGIPAVLSGEMKDTAQLNSFAVYGLEKFLSRSERADLLRAMPGISSMLPMGGDAVWGNPETGAPDDAPGQNRSFGSFITWRGVVSSSKHARNLTVGQSFDYVFSKSEPWYKEMVLRNYSYGVAHSREEVEYNQQVPEKWVNPLETRLPLAPSMRIYCFYGVGKPTERAYYYREDINPATPKTPVTIDTLYSNTSQATDHGVVMGEGDGTVNLLSSGYMCNRGWKMKRYNPGNVKITTHEMPHEPDRFNPRGGPNTGDHVDILGRSSLNDLILKIVGGKGNLVKECITSNIKQYADKVKIWDNDD